MCVCVCVCVCVEGTLEDGLRGGLFREGEKAKAPGREGFMGAVSNKKSDLKSISWPRRIILARVKYNVK